MFGDKVVPHLHVVNKVMYRKGWAVDDADTHHTHIHRHPHTLHTPYTHTIHFTNHTPSPPYTYPNPTDGSNKEN